MTPLRWIITGTVPLCFGFLFLASGISKLLRASSVLHMVMNYRLLWPAAARVFAAILGPIECVAGVLLLLSLFLPVYPAAWLLTVGLLIVFSLAVFSALLRGLKIPCGCGVLLNGHVIRWSTLARDLLLLCMMVLDYLVRIHLQSGFRFILLNPRFSGFLFNHG